MCIYNILHSEGYPRGYERENSGYPAGVASGLCIRSLLRYGSDLQEEYIENIRCYRLRAKYFLPKDRILPFPKDDYVEYHKDSRRHKKTAVPHVGVEGQREDVGHSGFIAESEERAPAKEKQFLSPPLPNLLEFSACLYKDLIPYSEPYFDTTKTLLSTPNPKNTSDLISLAPGADFFRPVYLKRNITKTKVKCTGINVYPAHTFWNGLNGLKRDMKRPKTIRAPDGPQLTADSITAY
ncbi:hypothetical protein NQ318_011554 [Aromia moschata]|uniref:Uncharacterized protein n=1 Tax=Aromia moschata TaxID=1265417 RepID=A0AAV8Z6E4_9CUCU|nr:hypothetical protein NQ318_011554 [Aromia moschata]